MYKNQYLRFDQPYCIFAASTFIQSADSAQDILSPGTT